MAPLVVSKVDDTKQSPTLGTTNDFLQHDENLAIMRSRIINGVLVDLNETADKINVIYARRGRIAKNFPRNLHRIT